MEHIIYQLLCVVVGFLYMKSSLGKIKNPYSFYRVMEGYSLIPKGRIAQWLAVLIGPLEFMVGVTICLNILRFEGIIAGAVLQVNFIVLMLAHMNQILPFGCGCFGMHAPEKVTWRKVAWNGVYLGALIVLFIGI
ncbi:MauE/DoxX family redox-associated membrane protein [Lihuaxuella thermophila]|uniref:Methylamine utilisation protein MauE n=1 Tax=Lihuaxuella thermophila TaxID=1173111 RepID=A0A1H8G7C6_9BACL|nr:MauE/DoxX family redox-associated membrane protein [Lihuaxuella thermophila]SEN39178.1 Methylamine utilisation protein MauE [Lihuaxuella thermophila]